MEKELSGEERRKYIIKLLEESSTPLSGARLGELTGVSRQVVVQDMALIRTQGYSILSTPRGYIIEEKKTHRVQRLVKVCHTTEQVEEELNLIVDLGGKVLDVMVNHRAYGKVRAALDIKNRRDVRLFVEDLKSGKSTPLLNVTSGYHYHTILAESEDILDEIEEELGKLGFLAEVLPYEEIM